MVVKRIACVVAISASVAFARAAFSDELIWRADFSGGGWPNRDLYHAPIDYVFSNDTVSVFGRGAKRDTAFALWSDPIPCDRKGKYAFEYVLETNFDTCGEERRGWAANGSNLYSSGVRWLDAAGKVISYDVVPIVCRANERRAFRIVGRIPAGSVSFSVRVGLDTPNMLEGMVLSIIGARLSAADEDDPLGFAYPAVDAPDIRIIDNAPRTDPTRPVVVEVVSEYQPVTVDGWKIDSVLVQPDEVEDIVGGHRYVFRNGGAAWTPGIHKLKVSAVDCGGFANSADKVFFVGGEPETPQVTLRNDGITLIDGEPFFPIGVYGVRKQPLNDNNYDKAIAGIKEGGFNTVHTYNAAEDQDYIAAVRKYGMKTFRNGSLIDARHVDSYRHDSSIIAWYVDDDTSLYHTVGQLCSRAENARATDSTRLICHADGIGSQNPSRYTYYAAPTDVFLPEEYPIYGNSASQDASCVAKVVKWTKTALDDNAHVRDGKPRAVWPIIQMFSGYTSWHRMPTATEFRAMVYAALACGVHGVTVYTYGATGDNCGVSSSEEIWAQVTNVIRSVSALAPVLVEPPCAQPPPPEVLYGPVTDNQYNPSITQLLKYHEGSAYLITVNSTSEPVSARFDAKASGYITVIGENRSIPASEDGGFTDDFGAFGVHVYRFNIGCWFDAMISEYSEFPPDPTIPFRGSWTETGNARLVGSADNRRVAISTRNHARFSVADPIGFHGVRRKRLEIGSALDISLFDRVEELPAPDPEMKAGFSAVDGMDGPHRVFVLAYDEIGGTNRWVESGITVTSVRRLPVEVALTTTDKRGMFEAEYTIDGRTVTVPVGITGTVREVGISGECELRSLSGVLLEDRNASIFTLR